jgi:hypothetical protein
MLQSNRCKNKNTREIEAFEFEILLPGFTIFNKHFRGRASLKREALKNEGEQK